MHKALLAAPSSSPKIVCFYPNLKLSTSFMGRKKIPLELENR
jgi:hypothetical protein